MSHKTIAFDEIAAALAPHRERGETIVQCHGTFDLVHPGHIIHLEEARALGQVLVVTITGERFVSKGPNRPYFNDVLRAHTLAALTCVDYVVVVPHAGAREAILAVRPTLYCKGEEFRSATKPHQRDRIDEDLAAAAEVGARVQFVGSQVFSSTRLLNSAFSPYDEKVQDYCRQLAATLSPEDFARHVDEFHSLRVLVIGDIIFDRYTEVDVSGLTSKSPAISSRFLRDELHGGGALAVLRHVAEFCADVKLIGVTGTEPWAQEQLATHLGAGRDLVVRIDDWRSVLKHRFTEKLVPGREVRPLFAVDYLEDHDLPPAALETLLQRLDAHIDQADLVLAMDFGHGLLVNPIRELVQDRARFLSVNCQTNSANFGFNVINRRYRRADSFSLDATELKLAAGAQRSGNPADNLATLMRALHAKYAWLTRGPVETTGLRAGDPAPCSIPPFERRVMDSIGAGDAFCALASLASARDLPLPLATFMGQLAGAMAVRYVGNSDCIRKSAFVRGGQTMLRF